MAFSAQGTIIKFSSATGITTAAGSGTAVGEVISYSFSPPTRNMIEVSNLGSTIETYIPGILRASQLTLECNYDPSNGGQTAMRDAALSTVQQSMLIMFPDSGKTKAIFEGYVSGMDVNAGTNDRARVTFTFQVNSPTSWGTYS